MVNLEWDNYDPYKRNCLTSKEKAMQELTHYYKTIFTLKRGNQIEICHKEHYEEVVKLEFENGHRCYKLKGFIKKPLLVEKEITIRENEVAAIETIKDPCIAQVVPWPEEFPPDEQDGATINKHPIDCNCQECSVSHPLDGKN